MAQTPQISTYKNPLGDYMREGIVFYSLVAADSGTSTKLPDVAGSMMVVHATFAAGLSINHTLVLPPVGSHAGKQILILLVSKSTASSITVDDEAGTDIAGENLDASGDWSIFTCTGQKWVETFDGIS